MLDEEPATRAPPPLVQPPTGRRISRLQRLRLSAPREGVVSWLGIRPEPGAAVRCVREVAASCDRGLIGDYASLSHSAKRQVTLMQAEHLYVIERLLDRREEVAPELLRRNIIVGRLNVQALIGMRFSVGPVLMEGIARCDPCELMEKTFGAGGYNAVVGHGGITAIVRSNGMIRVNDRVKLIGMAER